MSNDSPLSGAAISGPSAVYEYDMATWTASATGGFPPITYSGEIVVNGLVVHSGTGESVSYTNRGYWTDGPSFYVGVTARDATGATRSTSQLVSVLLCDGSQGPC